MEVRTDQVGAGYYTSMVKDNGISIACTVKVYRTLAYQLVSKLNKEKELFKRNRKELQEIVEGVLREYHTIYGEEVPEWNDFIGALEVGILVFNQKREAIIIMIGNMVSMELKGENTSPKMFRGNGGMKFYNNHMLIVNEYVLPDENKLLIMPEEMQRVLFHQKVYNTREKVNGGLIIIDDF